MHIPLGTRSGILVGCINRSSGDYDPKCRIHVEYVALTSQKQSIGHFPRCYNGLPNLHISTSSFSTKIPSLWIYMYVCGVNQLYAMTNVWNSTKVLPKSFHDDRLHWSKSNCGKNSHLSTCAAVTFNSYIHYSIYAYVAILSAKKMSILSH